MEIEYCCGDDGPAYFTRAHVPLDEFMAEVAKEVDPDDRILSEEPGHCWMRVCRNFQEEMMMYVEAKPESRGAFKCTWVQAY